jgi:hypothetical protein
VSEAETKLISHEDLITVGEYVGIDKDDMWKLVGVLRVCGVGVRVEPREALDATSGGAA